MKSLLATTLLSLMGASLAFAADYHAGYMQRKLGRLPPAQQKVVNAQRAATAFRAAPATVEDRYRATWFYKKFGRYTPAQQAEIDAYPSSSAYRATPVTPHVENSGTYHQRYIYRKFGRLP